MLRGIDIDQLGLFKVDVHTGFRAKLLSQSHFSSRWLRVADRAARSSAKSTSSKHENRVYCSLGPGSALEEKKKSMWAKKKIGE